jgi:hypothetical protein
MFAQLAVAWRHVRRSAEIVDASWAINAEEATQGRLPLRAGAVARTDCLSSYHSPLTGQAPLPAVVHLRTIAPVLVRSIENLFFEVTASDSTR